MDRNRDRKDGRSRDSAAVRSSRVWELRELSQELLKVLLGDWAGTRLRRCLDKRGRAEQRLLAANSGAAAIANELAALEEGVARTLLELQEELQRCRHRRMELQEETEVAQEAAASARASNSALRQELEELREQRQRLQEDGEKEDDGVPAAAYVTQLYYKISRIDWDYEAEPTLIKGIHYGPDIAQPINMDSSHHSSSFIADYLWSLVPTAW